MTIQHIEGWIGVENLFDSVIVFEPPAPEAAHSLPPKRSLALETYASQTRVALELKVMIHPDALALDLLYKATRPENGTVDIVLE